MKHILTILILCASLMVATAQPYLRPVGGVPLDGWVMDLWGYVAPDGSEYALVGHDDTLPGHVFNVISLQDPENPELLSSIEAMGFDIKTWQTYAYGVTGNNGSGTIVDLSDPANPSVVGEFPSGHNIFIDDQGYLFVSRPGISIYDLKNDPTQPELIFQEGETGHDIMVEGQIMYHFNEQNSTDIYDLSNPAEPMLIAQIIDPAIAYHHSGWTSTDGNYLYICDELARDSVQDITIWYIADLDNPQKVGGFIDTMATVHNLMVKGNYAYVSYYGNGTRVYDISDPTELQLLAEQDLNDHENENFGGNFGIYPFLPSGLILASESEYGLQVYTLNDTLDLEGEQVSRVFPNPVSGGNLVNIETNGYHKLYETWLTDAQGRIVMPINGRAFENFDFIQVSTIGLDAGVYFLKYLASDAHGTTFIASSDPFVVH